MSAPPAPKRVAIPSVPSPALAPPPGRWLYTCRAGFEPQLYEELAWQNAHPALLGAALVAADPARQPPAFARMGFEVVAVASGADEALARLPRGERICLQAWPVDTDAGNRLAPTAAALKEALERPLQAEGRRVPDAWTARRDGCWLWQVVPLDEARFVLGRVRPAEALSLSPGGRHRMRRGEAPSRAAMKLEEALDWLGLAPGRGDLCVDLGAAPGGWTARLIERGARVWAIDPGALTPELARHPKVRHFVQSAFAFEPPESADWLFCDMAWRPLEVAQLLAKWARRGWASMLVANLKLPMKDKLPMVHRARSVLEEGGWKDVRVRQLYHDRDEVTVTARR